MGRMCAASVSQARHSKPQSVFEGLKSKAPLPASDKGKEPTKTCYFLF